ncbi:MAG: histidine kinase [Pyrinomonadaceae bacterium]|nr:histidine kinase [Pyrinomonadaceae bacterium]
MKKSRYFWLLYCAAWSGYAVSLAVVFVGVGYRFNNDLLWIVLCNVLPAFLLGLIVVWIARRFSWKERKPPLFVLIHIFLLAAFTFLWCFFTLLDLSLLNLIQKATWRFVLWDVFGLQWQLFTGMLAYVALASAVYVAQINENLQAEERRNAELIFRAAHAEAARAKVELAALRAQLNPHFLFNTLHSLMALVRNDAQTAETAIEHFALMLRYVLQSQNAKQTADVTFAEEWRFVQNYLELERLRLGDRLSLTTDIDAVAYECYLPAFSLQPIVENAVKHAVAPRAVGGHIRITAHGVGENLVIEVSDDGTTNKPEPNPHNGNGLGLRLVRESLAARFGSAATLTTRKIPHEGFRVLITIPYQTYPFGESVDSLETAREI